jgi:hypothetical protein
VDGWNERHITRRVDGELQDWWNEGRITRRVPGEFLEVVVHTVGVVEKEKTD